MSPAATMTPALAATLEERGHQTALAHKDRWSANAAANKVGHQLDCPRCFPT